MTTPSLANRTERIVPFQVMELLKRAQAIQSDSMPVIHMSIGEPDFTAPPGVVQALEAAARGGHTQYTSAMGTTELRAAISNYYREQFHVDVSPARIVVTAGASAALSLACCALVNPGDRVLLTDPSYPCNRHFVAAFDGIPELIPVGPAERFQMTAAAVESHWREGVRGVLLATPSNPTGTSIPFDELKRILAAVRARNGFSIVDEIYLGLSYDGEARSVLELGDDMIVTNSFSKYFHMTGWRLGWLVVPEKLAPVFEKLSQNLFICPSALAQHAALACFTPESMAEYARRREAFHRRRDYLVDALRGVGLDVPVTPDGAFYIYADCSRFSDDSAAFADALLQNAHVSVVPGSDFGVHEPKRYLRISYATSLENLREAVARIGRYLATLPAAATSRARSDSTLAP